MVYRNLEICTPEAHIRNLPDGAGENSRRLHAMYTMLKENVVEGHKGMSWTQEEVRKWARSDPRLKTRKRHVVVDEFPPLILFKHPLAVRVVVADPWSDEICAKYLNTRTVQVSGTHDMSQSFPNLPAGTVIEDPSRTGPWSQNISLNCDMDTSAAPVATCEGDMFGIHLTCLPIANPNPTPVKRRTKVSQTTIVQFASEIEQTP